MQLLDKIVIYHFRCDIVVSDTFYRPKDLWLVSYFYVVYKTYRRANTGFLRF